MAHTLAIIIGAAVGNLALLAVVLWRDRDQHRLPAPAPGAVLKRTLPAVPVDVELRRPRCRPDVAAAVQVVWSAPNRPAIPISYLATRKAAA